MLVAVCLVATNLRMTITGVGPLLEQIAADQGVPTAALGGLASVPLLAWAIVSPVAHGLSLRFGLSRMVTWSLMLLAIGTLWRSAPGGPEHLWLGTALVGAALAIGNVLLPAVIRREFPTRLPFVMGLYTGLLGACGAVSAGLMVPISQVLVGDQPLGWRVALLTSGALIPIAAVAWLIANRAPAAGASVAATPEARNGELPLQPASGSAAEPTPATASPTVAATGRSVWGDAVAWRIAGYMGTQSMLFYMAATWLAAIRTSTGTNEVAAGLEVAAFQVIGITGSLALPLLYRGRATRWLPAAIPLLFGIGFAGAVLSTSVALPWILLCGFASGASLSLALLFMAVRTREQATAGALSGMAQSVGYLIAAAGPAVFGWFHSATGGWIAPLGFLLAVACAQLLLGLTLGGGRMVFDRRAPRT